MGKHYFTQQQIEYLQNNKYVKRVSEKSITYTEEFKEVFLIEYNRGKAPTLILKSMGFDCQALGRKRIDNIVQSIKKQSQRPEGFKDTRADTSTSSKYETADYTTEQIITKQNAEIKLLRAKVEYLSVLTKIEKERKKINSK